MTPEERKQETDEVEAFLKSKGFEDFFIYCVKNRDKRGKDTADVMTIAKGDLSFIQQQFCTSMHEDDNIYGFFSESVKAVAIGRKMEQMSKNQNNVN